MMMWGWGGGAWSWPWALMGVVSMLLFWGLVVLLVVWVVRSLRGPSVSTPLEIAKRRYASGEISREQYEQLRHDLSA